MRLSIKDRIQLPAILLKQGGYVEMIVKRDILRQIEFTSAEVEDFQMKDNKDGTILWNPRRARDKVLELTDQQIDLMKKSLKNLDESGGVTDDLLPLCEKINDL